MIDRNKGSAANRPRHIRDIAHLYLSRRRRALARPPVSVILRGEDRECFPAWHAANLAVALAGRRMSVWVGELSGLIPNVAFHLGLSPREYLAEDGEPYLYEAISGVRVSLAPWSKSRPSPDLMIFHVPPVLDHAPEGQGRAGVPVGEGTVELSIRHRDTPLPGSAVVRGAAGAPVEFWASGVSDAGTDELLGRVAGWEHHLADRYPVVIARPGGPLARGYFGVCDALVARVDTVRRRAERNERVGIDARPVERSHR